MEFINRLAAYSPLRKFTISFILVVGYALISATAPLTVSFALVTLGFAPLIILSLLYPWQVGALFGGLVPFINAVMVYLRNDPEFNPGRRLIGILSGAILGLTIGLIRDQWLKMQQVETAMEDRVREKTEALQKQNDYLLALHETTLALINHLELHTLLEFILQRACQLSETSHGFIDLVTPDKTSIRQELGLGEFVNLNGVSIEAGQGITGRVWESGKLLQVEDYPTWSGHIPAYRSGVHAIVGLPLIARDEVIGVLGLAYAEPGRIFTPEQIRQLEQFARLASLAYENARLYQTAQNELLMRTQVETEVRKFNDELEQRVLDRTVQLEYANRELQSFSYSISHDLRPPLRAIDGYSRIVIDDYQNTLPPEALDLLHQVRRNAQKMDRLINDILNFTRLGRHKLRRTPINIKEDIVQAFQQAATEFTDSDRVRLVVDALPENINADPALLHVIFTHLLGNAIKFSRNTATPQVEVGCTRLHDTPTFYVKDNGIGFDMKYAQKVFSVFERLHTESEFEGTGVGLAIVQRAIQIHEGRIWVNSAPGKGATFYFTLGEI